MKTPLEITGALSALECEILGQVASETTATRALEVGHFHGRSTVVLLDSLPAGCSLTTIDHHHGDYWCSATDPDEVFGNMFPHVGAREFEFIDGDMHLCDVTGLFGFVFYDADHTADAVSAWWQRYHVMLEPDCTLVFDDADWEDQSILTAFAVAAGFRSVRTIPFWRDVEADKGHPKTYTVEVMRRDA